MSGIGIRMTSRAGLFAAALSLAGCAVGPDFKPPDIETPEAYRTPVAAAPDSLLDLRWWELFDDPALDTLVTRALSANRDVLAAASRVEEARAALGFNGADRFPSLTFEGSATRGNLAGRSKTAEEFDSYYIAPVLSWEIDFWGKYRRATEAAKAEMLSSEYGLRTVQIGLITDVAGTWFLLLDYRDRLDIARRTLESRERTLDIIQKRFDKGTIPLIDLNQAQIQREIAVGAIPLFERLVARTENTLSVLTGALPGAVGPNGTGPSVDEPEIPVGLPSTLLERRPDVARARYQAQAQNARIGVATAMRLPSISLTGILGFASDELSELTTGDPAWSAGGSLFGPIFQFNKNARRVDVEEERARQLLLAYEQTVLNAFREVEDALVDVRTYREQVASTERKLGAAQSAAHLSLERYDRGVTSYLEVLDTERTLFSVELELSELRQQYRSAYLALYKALGGGWITREELEAAQGAAEE